MPRTKVTHVSIIQQVSSSSTILVVDDDQDAPDPIEYLSEESEVKVLLAIILISHFLLNFQFQDIVGSSSTVIKKG